MTQKKGEIKRRAANKERELKEKIAIRRDPERTERKGKKDRDKAEAQQSQTSGAKQDQ